MLDEYFVTNENGFQTRFFEGGKKIQQWHVLCDL
jgi:hypothetical protein